MPHYGHHFPPHYGVVTAGAVAQQVEGKARKAKRRFRRSKPAIDAMVEYDRKR